MIRQSTLYHHLRSQISDFGSFPPRVRSACCAVISLLSASALAGTPYSVDLSRPQGWIIVVPKDATPAERYAAEELKALYGEASGRELPVLTPDAAPSEGAPGGIVLQWDENLGPEDFRIVFREKKILIFGGRPRGVLYGVYTFLEDYLGVRFLTADHTYVPKLEGWRVIGPLDRTYHPPLRFRWAYYGENNTNPAFATRLRNNTIATDEKYGGTCGYELINHSFGRQIPSQKYGKEHPEYFAEIDGKRLAPVENDFHQTEPCLTHPDVLKIVTQSVLDDLKANPGRLNISVSQNDNDKYCRCVKCREIDEREGTPMGTLLTFVNAVADEVAKHHPDVKVGTLSYWYTRKPPRTIKPRPNVQIQFCSIECCEMHPLDRCPSDKNRAFCQEMEDWGKLCSDISIWNYNVNFSAYQLPFPILPVIERNVRYFMAHHARGIFMQAAGDTTGSAFSDLHNYVISNMLWDPNRSGDQLRDEFLRLHYGRAALPIRRIIERLEEKGQASERHPNCFGPASHYGQDEALAREALQAFDEALQLAGDDAALKARVEKASLCAYRMAIEPCFRAKPDDKLAPDLVERMKPLVKTFFTLGEKYKVANFREGNPMSAGKQQLVKLLWGDQPAGF